MASIICSNILHQAADDLVTVTCKEINQRNFDYLPSLRFRFYYKASFMNKGHNHRPAGAVRKGVKRSRHHLRSSQSVIFNYAYIPLPLTKEWAFN